MKFEPTNLTPGSVEKIALLKARHEHGLPLWHKNDRVDYAGIFENQIFTGKQRKEKLCAYEPKRSRVVSSGKKMRVE